MAYQQKRAVKYARAESVPATDAPSMTNIGWAAGFLEGEGSFSTNKHRAYPSVCVRATQKTMQPLFRMQQFFGGSVRVRPSDGYGEWRTYGARAAGIAMTPFPLMSARRQGQIKVALTAGGY